MTALFHLEQCGYLIANIYKKTFCTSNILNNFIFLFCLQFLFVLRLTARFCLQK